MSCNKVENEYITFNLPCPTIHVKLHKLVMVHCVLRIARTNFLETPTFLTCTYFMEYVKLMTIAASETFFGEIHLIIRNYS